MSKKPLSLFGSKSGKPTMKAAMERIGDGGGLHKVGSRNIALSTPIVSSQDGPRMSGQAFGGKKAAPFVKGGGRSKKHPNDAKGRKRAAAKAALAAKGADLSNAGQREIDLAYLGFSKLKAKLAAKGASDPGALAAAIGRKKYGAKKFAAAAAKGTKLGKKR